MFVKRVRSSTGGMSKPDTPYTGFSEVQTEIDADWMFNPVHQDLKHFMGNLHKMVRKKTTSVFKAWPRQLSDATLYIMAESKREVSDHLIKLYCTDKAGHRKAFSQSHRGFSESSPPQLLEP